MCFAGPQPPYLSPDTATLLLALCEVMETASSTAAFLGVLPTGVASFATCGSDTGACLAELCDALPALLLRHRLCV